MTTQSIDPFQERYTAHQERKLKGITLKYEENNHQTPFKELMMTRVSQRFYNDKKITKEEYRFIKEAIVNTPSSCNRQPIQIMEVEDKEAMDRLLVGGKNWVSKADKILLLVADMKAYKSPAEVSYMSYLDAGFIGMSVYYACEVLNIGVCFINPNIREENQEEFKKFVGDYRFCGALALGHYDKKAISIKKSNNIFI
jgi:nitroreductase